MSDKQDDGKCSLSEGNRGGKDLWWKHRETQTDTDRFYTRLNFNIVQIL